MTTALLLDNDGLLLDTEALFFELSRTHFAASGLQIDEPFWAREYLGKAKRSLQIALELGLGEREARAMVEERNRCYRELLSGEVPLRSGVAETLAGLHGKVRLAMVTGSPRDQVARMHRHTGLLDLFEVVVTDDDVRNSKPHPEPYRKALGLLGLEARESFAVEDSVRGAGSAIAAGLRCLVVPNSLTRLQEFNGVHAVLEEFPEILAHL